MKNFVLVDPEVGFLDAVTTHNVLSSTHTDTTASSCARGSVIVGDSSSKWVNLAFPGTPTGKVLIATATDVEWSGSALGTAAYTASTAYEVPLTFSSGLTRTVNAVANDLITGKTGGQTIYGDTATGGNITISSTLHGTKGKIVIGTTNYDEVNNRLGLGVTTPLATLHLKAGTATAGTGSFKITTAVNLLTTPEAGVLEYSVDDYYLSIATGPARKGIMLNDGTALTSGRIPVATTNGRLTNFAGLTYSDTTGLATTKNVTLSAGNLTLSALASASNKIGVVDTSGQIVAGGTVLEATISDGTAIALLIDNTNWTLGIYGGTALTNVYAGQIYVDDNYKYEMYTDSYPVRLPRA
jgi:hypothetical protein